VIEPPSKRALGPLPVAPSMTDDPVGGSRRSTRVTSRLVYISALAVGVALGAATIAVGLTRLIGFVTNLAFYGRISTAFVSPADNKLGLAVIIVPVIGGVLVGIMARWGSAAIRGHGIPEAMEQILFNESRVAPRLTFLKPLSAAIAIGTGGPFGAEGPIIATGGAVGSVLGQLIPVTAHERKTLLAAGAAAGMAATFGTPVAAVLLAVELLLFEYRAQSLIPVSLACVAAATVRGAFAGFGPVFAMPHLDSSAPLAVLAYVTIGAVLGVFSVWITRGVYAVEDLFEHIPVHWMWWPAIGGLAVGVIGYVSPHTMGVGYDNIEHILSGTIVGKALFLLCILKFASWIIALSSGTSGGTLAPLFTVGGALGALFGAGAANAFPSLAIDPRMAAVVGMAALFAGASHATLASVVFAYETTHQGSAVLPLLAGCTASYLVSCLMMRTSIMTEKIARRGVRVHADYAVDALDTLSVKDGLQRDVTTVRGSDLLDTARAWVRSGLPGTTYANFPVVADDGRLLGVVSRRDLETDGTAASYVRELAENEAVVIYEDDSLREAAAVMSSEGVDLLPVVPRTGPRLVVGVVGRSDLLKAFRRGTKDDDVARPNLRLRGNRG
jgi:CIC family chloride channel protein